MVKFAVERAKVEVRRKKMRKQFLLQFSSINKFKFLFFYFINDFFINIILKDDSALLKVILFLFSTIENNLSFYLTSLCHIKHLCKNVMLQNFLVNKA
jgi:hypothetical protein